MPSEMTIQSWKGPQWVGTGKTAFADKTQQRCLVIIVTSIVGGVGYIVLATVETVGVRYFATFLASAGVFSTIPHPLFIFLVA